jgi:cytoskeletal protein CcmA (bactofilin family)
MPSGRGSVRITGTGTSAGGDFDKVAITGEGVIQGDLRCDRFTCTGTCSVEGGLSAKRLRLLGEACVEGKLEGNELRMTGSVEARGGASAGRIVVRGELKAGGDVEADKLHARGVFAIDGLLGGEETELILYGQSRIRELGGGRIRVRRRGFRPLKAWFKGAGPEELTAKTIEGDDLYLEYTIADVVRGKRIELGPGCRIGRAEYSESLLRHKDAQVGEARKEQ